MRTSFESKTLHIAVEGTAYQITFSTAKLFVAASVQFGTFWLRPHPPGDTPGTLPTSPIVMGAVVDGWTRLVDGSALKLGVDQYSAATIEQLPDDMAEHVAFIDVWCEGSGTLTVVSH